MLSQIFLQILPWKLLKCDVAAAHHQTVHGHTELGAVFGEVLLPAKYFTREILEFASQKLMENDMQA
jgi:hypothetical protein